MSEATPLLELRGVRAAYDRIDVLFGVDLAVAEVPEELQAIKVRMVLIVASAEVDLQR